MGIGYWVLGVGDLSMEEEGKEASRRDSLLEGNDEERGRDGMETRRGKGIFEDGGEVWWGWGGGVGG